MQALSRQDFDMTNKLAIGLTRTTLKWGGYGTDITTMTNYTSSSAALADTTSGKTNTSRIVAALGSGTSYAAPMVTGTIGTSERKASLKLPALNF